ncbi:MAG: hypothetical protein U9R79_16275 [Armatimonadota bacterium]|nr:hypothetical protein [Armatimonadota bacterium]
MASAHQRQQVTPPWVALAAALLLHGASVADDEGGRRLVLIVAEGPSAAQRASDLDLRVTGKRGSWAGDPEKLFTGVLIGLTAHESGHLLANALVGSSPHGVEVEFAGIPFFTIEPGHKLSDRDHYITASAGFHAQHLVNEWLLTEHPDLRNEDDAMLKGLAALNFWLSVGYAASAITQYGPHERDTNGMADSLGWDEPAVGLLILAPTLLDRYRYDHPDEEWARDASRAVKVLIVGLALAAD